ncbi:Cardiolipin synthase A [Candidatus Erwinia haradaeae]|uniref:Cardiolipin synthase A n=1 Tax=Candidatus Erwinia haradaeae TaxID=1922217 RepID=A0A451D058_9GAMM|nr:cardiolipin synthase [Candidatus Erwinia haradaeae]VFP78815.1 Cardiolipin synthase A [Candidatus Erwinia haradaeae]
MITFYTITNWLLIFSYWLLIAGVTLRVLIKRRSVPFAMAWLLIIYILPLLGIIAYLSLGELYLGKLRTKRARTIWLSTSIWLRNLKSHQDFYDKQNSDIAQPLFQLCEKRQGIAGVKGNQFELLTTSNSTLKNVVQDIQLALNNIEMVFYIWQPGGLADDVAKALMAASRRGVHCRLLLDSAGSVEFFRTDWPNLMRNAGIDVVEALPVSLLRIFLRRMDIRQHRKVVLIDNHIAYTGSMNLVDPLFFKQESGVGQWVDLMARIEGPIATVMGIIYSGDWEIETGKHIPPPSVLNHTTLPLKKTNDHTILVIASGPGFPKEIIHQSLLTVIYSSKKTLIITTPYLVPSDNLLHAICTASYRGVDVKIVVPRHNDSILVRWASRAFFSELLESGVKIYQFEGGLLHSKSILVDGQLSLIGTVNLDMRSLLLNFEITLVIDDDKCGRELSRIQNEYISQSRLVDALLWSQRAYWKRIIERLFYFFSPLL